MSSTLNFNTLIQGYYEQKRQMPWREPPFDVYGILVSEMMLQQTQVARVIPKYNQFLNTFKTMEDLANAPLADVLKAWSGLGYNRRAKYLHDAAKQLAGIKRPMHIEDLMACKGIGRNTAGAVVVYAYDVPYCFIETNVRTVYIHHFFSDKSAVADTEIMDILEQTLDKKQPRKFYYALMDYGTYLKKHVGNATQRSRHYKKQSSFEGSFRQVRGEILKALADRPHTTEELIARIKDSRTQLATTKLIEEGIIRFEHNRYKL